MGSLGMPEILVILVIALIIFGPRKLPELGKSLGQGLAHFRRASEDFKRQWEDEVDMERRRIDSPVQSAVEHPYNSEYEAAPQPPPNEDHVAEVTPESALEATPAVSHSETVAREADRDWS
jgi:TatA/E family protein of Tat protein translocase